LLVRYCSYQVKSSQQLIPIPEVREIITSSRAHLEDGNLTGAFELAQDASQLLHQITGPLHKETAMTVDLITNVLLEAGILFLRPLFYFMAAHSISYFPPPWHFICYSPFFTPSFLGDNVLALTTASKSLSVSVQLTGLDSQNSAQHHGQVAALLADLGNPLIRDAIPLPFVISHQ
jgi:hypothetical protein